MACSAAHGVGWGRWLPSFAIAGTLLLLIGGEASARTDPRIGRAEKVVLDVRAVMPEAERRLVVNEDVFRDDIIATQARSATRLVFRDETYLSIGPESRVRLANLPVAQDDGEPFVVDAAKGVFKFVSGRLRSDRYQLKTPAATIGVRGTIVWMTVRADGVTEVASQDGEVTVCAQGACVTLQPGEYSRSEPGAAPTPPADVPDAFYAQIRDMLIRLLMASDEFGVGFGANPGGTGPAGPEALGGGSRGGRTPPALSGLGLASRGGGTGGTVPGGSANQARPGAATPPFNGPPGEAPPDGSVQVDSPATAVLLIAGLLALAGLLAQTGRSAVAADRRRD